MQLNTLIKNIREKQPQLITPFISEYFTWADIPETTKPYFYGKWSLKWALAVILPSLTEMETKNLIHHIIIELATLENAEEVAQFAAIKLVALHPWKQMLNNSKNEINVKTLEAFSIGGFKIVVKQYPKQPYQYDLPENKCRCNNLR